MASTVPLCVCHHWWEQHSDDRPDVINPACQVDGCRCLNGFLPVARGSTHRPGRSTHANPRPVSKLVPGKRVLVEYLGDGKIILAHKLADSLIAEVEKVSYSGQGDLWHLTTDLGLIPLVKGRSSVRVVNKP